jgi:hypothetical protein
LANGTHGEQCPFNDPHTAAPHLWLLSRLDGALLEFSCTPVPGNRGVLRGTEDMLLWRHRVENKCSTEANYGRFFPGWSRPTNRWVQRGGNRTEGRRAARLPEGQQPPSFDMTEAALQGDGPVLSAPWWERAPLSGAGKLPSGPAVYCIFDGAQSEPAPVYVGETSRLSACAARTWPRAGQRVTRGSPIELFPARRSMSCMSLRATCWDGSSGARGQRRHANTAPSTTVLMTDEPFVSRLCGDHA